MAENVLGGLLGYSNALKRRIRGLLDDPVNFLESALYDVIPRPEEAAAVDPRNLSATPFDSPYVQKTLQMGGLLGPTVWHGSPYKFMKFDSNKIGSGEGAQAYGYGHYVAENPGVAREYQKSLAGERFIGTDDAGKWRVFEATKNGETAVTKGFASKEEAQSAANQLGHYGGNLYKIDLPDEAAAKMLDWDRPLSQQSGATQAAIESSLKSRGFEPWQVESLRARDPIGDDLYAALVGMKGPKAGSAVLRSHGIPGIRYLDQGSRGTGKGTYNYVVFPGNEDLLRILEINGQPVNALKGLLGQ